MGLPGGGHGGLGAAVEGVESGDYLVGAVALRLAVASGQLHGALDSLGAAVAEEHQVEAAVLDESLGQLQLGNGVELVGGLDQGASLLGDGLGDGRMAVAQLIHRPAGDEVQVLLAVGVPDLGAVAPDDDHRLAAHRLGVILLFDIDPVAAVAHGESSTPECPSAKFHSKCASRLSHTRRNLSHGEGGQRERRTLKQGGSNPGARWP